MEDVYQSKMVLYYAIVGEADRSPRLNLIRLRQNAGLSRRELAASLGLKSVRAVNAWESGTYGPGVQHLIPLANALGVPIVEVIEAITDQRAETPHGLRQAPPESPVVARDTVEQLSWHLGEMARLIRELQDQQATEVSKRKE